MNAVHQNTTKKFSEIPWSHFEKTDMLHEECKLINRKTLMALILLAMIENDIYTVNIEATALLKSAKIEYAAAVWIQTQPKPNEIELKKDDLFANKHIEMFRKRTSQPQRLPYADHRNKNSNDDFLIM